MVIKSKVPMPVYKSKYQGLKQTSEYRDEFDRIFGKHDHIRYLGQKIQKKLDKKEK